MSILDFLKGKGLTKPALVGPNGPTFYDSDQAAMDAAANALGSSQQEPSLSVTQPVVTGATTPTPDLSNVPDAIRRPDDQVDPGAPQLQVAGGQVNLSDPTNKPLPHYANPDYASRTTDQYGNVTSPEGKGLTKGGFLMTLLRKGIQGASDAVASGALNAERGKSYFGAGFQGATEMPFVRAQRAQAQQAGQIQNEMAQNAANAYNIPVDVGGGQMAPLGIAGQLAGLRKTQSEIGKNEAEGTKFGAEAGAIPAKTALEQAQAAAAKYKEVGGVMYDVSGPTPVPVQGAGTFVPLDEQSAKVAGLPAGTKLPLEQATKLKQLADAGISSVQANGHSLLVDKTGKTIADLGAATPIVIQNQMNPFGSMPTPTSTGESALQGANPLQAAIIRGVANYTIDPDKLPLYRSPQAKFQLLAAVKAYNPNYDETRYGAKAAFMHSAIGGKIGDEINAYNTALAHADLLDAAAKALSNGNTRALNSIKNEWEKQFGSPLPTNYSAIANAYNHEVTAAIAKGHITDKEISSGDQQLPLNASYPQIAGTVGTFKALMDSKMQQRMNQMDQAMQGNPNFSNLPQRDRGTANPNPQPKDDFHSKVNAAGGFVLK